MSTGIAAPLHLYRDQVRADWIDYNGHMSEAFYVLTFGFATDAFLDFIGMDPAYRQSTGTSLYTVEAHICYLRELRFGTLLSFSTHLLGCDEKRVHLFHEMHNDAASELAATIELLLLHYDQRAGRVTPLPDALRNRLEQIRAVHDQLPRPVQAGRAL